MRPVSVLVILSRTPRRASGVRNDSTRSRKKSGRLSGDRRNAFRRPGKRPACAEFSPACSRDALRRRGTARGGVLEGAAVIGKISAPRGERVEPLIYYLFGPGRREEHTDPHIVAGWRHPAEMEPPLCENGKGDFRRLLGLLNQPHA